MKMFNNPTFRTPAVTALVTTAVTFAVLLFVNRTAAFLTLTSELLICILGFVSARRRYREIARLSELTDRVLHGYADVLISESGEGELAVLADEITKMTVRLREQSDSLRRDREFLSSSLADISHQLRTPLTSMTLTVQMLSDPDISPQKRTRLVRELKKSLSRLDWLIESLLKMSRIDAGTLAFISDTVYVSDLITAAVEPLRISMELKELSFRSVVADEKLTGDMRWCTEAIGNILKNCVEHTPIGGTISLTASETPIFTEIVIRDNGGGFSEDDIPHIFERFYRGKNASAESVGIGLALSRMLITGQNGTVSAENTDDGAEFTVRFYKEIL